MRNNQLAEERITEIARRAAAIKELEQSAMYQESATYRALINASRKYEDALTHGTFDRDQIRKLWDAKEVLRFQWREEEFGI